VQEVEEKTPFDIFEDLYENFIIERVYAMRNVNANPSKRGKLTEIIIRNYKSTLTPTTNTIDNLKLAI
jgi:DNA adenine methylase